jgi:hypothetical protein
LRARGATHLALYPGAIWWIDSYPEFAEYLARSSMIVSASSDHLIYELTKRP